MIIEFSRGEGEIFLSGRACSLWLGQSEEEIIRTIERKDVILRSPSGWEGEILRPALSRPSSSLGAPLLGEESTVWLWNEDRPGFVYAETDEVNERGRLLRYPWAEEIFRCYRSDALTSRFLLPSPLLRLF